ncbi:MAG: preprotein translocase subunit YajC [Planctomycetota bacterium]
MVCSPWLFLLEEQGGGSGFGMLPLLVVIFAIFYFIVIRPQSRQNKVRQQMLRDLKKNDRVVTTAGIYGTVTALGETDVTLLIDESQKVRVKMTRNSIAAVLSGEGEEAPTSKSAT